MSRPVEAALGTGTKIIAGILLAIPLIALGAVPMYSKADPHLWGFPFFYWYQLLWVFLASACTWAAHLIIVRARRGAS